MADPADLGWLLAHHWREAGEVDAARAYLLGAAERARDTLAVEETYDLFTRALDLATTDEDRRRIRLRRGLVLVELGDNERGDKELAELVPELDGVDEIDALIARSRATLWTEQTNETLSLSERALELVRARGPAKLEAIALTRLAQAYGMRGNDGDLSQAIELADQATERWPGEERLLELAEHYHMHANALYWAGSYERALELSELAAATGGLERRSAEFLLRGAGQRALILSSLGRYEDAIAAGDGAIETARRMGRAANVVTNYSTLPLREIFAGEEAGLRSEAVADQLGPSSFNMPWINARADLMGAQVLMDDLAAVERSWSSLWDDAIASDGWERWLITGRLAAYRAELDLTSGRLDDALTWSSTRDRARGTREPAEVPGEREDDVGPGAHGPGRRRERGGRAPLGRRARRRARLAAPAVAEPRRARGRGARREGSRRERRGRRARTGGQGDHRRRRGRALSRAREDLSRGRARRGRSRTRPMRRVSQLDCARRNPPRCSGRTLNETPDPSAACRIVSNASSLGLP